MAILPPLVLSVLGPALVAVMSSSPPSPRPTPPPSPTAAAAPAAAPSLLAAHLAGPGCRIVLAMRRGQVVGVRLFGITPASPLRAWGLENGDILVAAGDEALTGPEALLRLASQTGLLALTVERRGQRFGLEVAAR